MCGRMSRVAAEARGPMVRMNTGLWNLGYSKMMFSTLNYGFRPSPFLKMSMTTGTQARPTQYGQAYYNFNGIKYNKGTSIGHSIAQNESKQLLDFTANTIWDNPGARRYKKQLGRGNGSGKG